MTAQEVIGFHSTDIIIIGFIFKIGIIKWVCIVITLGLTLSQDAGYPD
jgi:hypothetical protein